VRVYTLPDPAPQDARMVVRRRLPAIVPRGRAGHCERLCFERL